MTSLHSEETIKTQVNEVKPETTVTYSVAPVAVTQVTSSASVANAP